MTAAMPSLTAGVFSPAECGWLYLAVVIDAYSKRVIG